MTATRAIPRKRSDHLRSRQVMADQVEPLDDEAREIISELQQLRTERDETEKQIHLIPLRQLERHPKNRVVDPNDPSIQSLSHSIVEHGQLDPLRVRQLSDARYQIISGERRFTAMQIGKVTTARCIVVNIDDATALQEVAVANGNREDLNPVQRAELMQELMKPKDKGGSGLSLVEAGKLFGLNSESGSKNALRVLKLPDKIRQLVVSGDLPERAARALVPYTVFPKLMDAITKELPKQLESWAYELGIGDRPHAITYFIIQNARPVSDDVKHRYSWPVNDQPCLFDWSKHESELNIVELPWDMGDWQKHKFEQRRFALNIKLWDKLQQPFIKAIQEKHERKSKSPSSKSKAKTLTPAEEAADTKRRAKEQSEQLDRFSKDWACRLLRCAIAGRSTDEDLVAFTLPWLVGQCDQSDLCRYHEQAFVECHVDRPRAKHEKSWGRIDTLPYLSTFDKHKSKGREVQSAFWRVLLWPVSDLLNENSKSLLTPAGKLPDKLPGMLDLNELTQLAAIAGVSIASAWKAGTVDDSDERRLISVWLMRHTKEQLQKLTMELPTGGVAPSVWTSKEPLAKHVLAAHKPGKPLALPKRLQKLDTK